MSGKAKPAFERFERQYIPEPNTGCWFWIGATPKFGYGAFKMEPKSSRSIGAHRASWILHKGEIPKGMFVCHKCDVPSCVNPEHLFLGTAKDNMSDASRKGRMNWKEGEVRNLKIGRDHWSSKLTPDDVCEIRASSEMGIDLAKRFKVTPNTISRVRRRIIWRHVP